MADGGVNLLCFDTSTQRFTQASLDILQDFVDRDEFAEAYSKIVRAITGIDGQQVDGVEQAAFLWFNGATRINAGEGRLSDFIRDYTAEQVVTRFGESARPDEPTLQQTSDNIVEAVIKNILQLEDTQMSAKIK